MSFRIFSLDKEQLMHVYPFKEKDKPLKIRVKEEEQRIKIIIFTDHDDSFFIRQLPESPTIPISVIEEIIRQVLVDLGASDDWLITFPETRFFKQLNEKFYLIILRKREGKGSFVIYHRFGNFGDIETVSIEGTYRLELSKKVEDYL